MTLTKQGIGLRRAWLTGFTAFALLGCVPTWVAEPVQPQRTISEGAIRVTRNDDSVILLRAPVTVGDSLTGTALNDPQRRVAIPLSEIATIETRGSRKATGGDAMRGYLMYVTALVAAGTILVMLQ